MSNSKESLLRKKEWDNRFQRDVNGMPALCWKVVLENKELIIYETTHINYRSQTLFPDDLKPLHLLGNITQINFEKGKVKIFVEKWKKKEKEN